MTSSALLQLISAAVTPVVMISACAALILGINNKHTAISDRLRNLLAECRRPETPESRRSQLLEESRVFYKRFRLTWAGLYALYAAVITFTLTALLLLLTQRNLLTFHNGTLTLFIAGIVLMIAATVFELFEIRLSHHSLRIEMQDVVIPREK